MPFGFFENGVNNDIIQMPNEKIRDMQQASISSKFEETTARYVVEEQCDYGSSNYQKIEVWIDNVVGMTSRGATNGDDFKQFMFKDIDHEVKRGLYYLFNNNTWITYFTDEFATVSKDVGVRRCNNVLKIIDPDNGGIFCIPCVVEYDMTSPSMQVTSSILTPNNHAIVKVQGNKDTHRLFKINSRFILGGRPFKLLAFQNALINPELSNVDTLLELDMYLDETHAEDDIENQIADNGKFDYNIVINSHDMSLISGSKGFLEASVTLNGQEVNREVVWESLNPAVVKINQKGEYEVVGKDGQETDIMATLKGNDKICATVKIQVDSTEVFEPKIIINPTFDKLRQYESVDFDVVASYGGRDYDIDKSIVSIGQSEIEMVLSNEYIDIEKNGNHYKIKGKKISSQPIVISISVENNSPNFRATQNYSIRIVSMFG